MTASGDSGNDRVSSGNAVDVAYHHSQQGSKQVSQVHSQANMAVIEKGDLVLVSGASGFIAV